MRTPDELLTAVERAGFELEQEPQTDRLANLLRHETQARLSESLCWLLALDDRLNDQLSAQSSGKSGFLK
jgi:hypothetical protein